LKIKIKINIYIKNKIFIKINMCLKILKLSKGGVSTFKNKSGGISKKIKQPLNINKWTEEQIIRHNKGIEGGEYIEALVLKKDDGIFCFDVDNKGDTIKEFNEFVEENNLQHIYNTYHEYTPNGGLHLIFKYDPNVNIENTNGVKVDIIKNGISILAPSSYTCSITNEEKKYIKGKIELNITNILDYPMKLNEFITKQIKDIEIHIDHDIISKLDHEEISFYNYLANVSYDTNDTFKGWITLGIICYNFFKGGVKGLQLWWLWSKGCKNVKYNTDEKNFNECVEHYTNKFYKKYNQNLTIKKLATLSNYNKNERIIINTEEENNGKLTIEWHDFQLKWHGSELNENIEYIIKDAKKTFCYISDGDYIVLLNSQGYSIDFADKKKSPFSLVKTIITNQGMKKNDVGLKKFISLYFTKLNTKRELIFEPNNYSDKFFNLWVGYKAKYQPTYDIEIIKPVLNHIHKVWCGNDDKVYHYVLSWLKSVITKPEEKTKVALLVIDPTFGAGKGIITDFLLDYVIGRIHGCNGNIKDLLGEYNMFIKEKTLVVFDELPATKEEYFSQCEELKRYITDHHIRVGDKYKPKVSLKSFQNYIMFSNNLNCLPIKSGDRRFCVLKANNEFKTNYQYFKDLADKCHNEECGNSFYSFIQDYETDIKLLDIPQTELKTEIQELNDDNHVNFMKEVKSGEYRIVNYEDESECEDGDEEGEYQIPTKIKTTKLYENYSKWCDRSGERKFKKILFFKKLLNDYTKVKHKGFYYIKLI
jgi:hypothetical protein